MPDCPQIKEVEKRYAEAETALKSYERITLTNLAPAINQLRYAGNHLLRASSETDDAEREKHVLAAEWHSRRALYDAREATVIFLLDEFREYSGVGHSSFCRFDITCDCCTWSDQTFHSSCQRN